MPARIRISLLSCVFALAIAGCGSGDDGTIPRDTSDDLLTLLAATEEALGEGECERAAEYAQQIVDQTSDLPGGVDPQVAEELTAAAANLDTLANDPEECTGTGASGEDGVEPTTSTTTTTEPVETTTEEPTTTEETTTEEPTTTIEEEPENQGGQGEPVPPSGQGGGSQGGIEPPSGGVGAGGGAG